MQEINLKNISKTIFISIYLSFLFFGPCHAAADLKILILHDQQKGSLYEKMGLAYAIMLENLLGHFNCTVKIMPVTDYAPGKIEQNDAVFYLGSVYDNPLSEAFLKDVSKTKKSIIWFKYNIWQLTKIPVYAFTNRYGFAFQSVRGMNAKPSASEPNPGFFDRVQYKGFEMDKFYRFDQKSGSITGDPDVGMVNILDRSKAKIIATVLNQKTKDQIPYVVHADNFWYFADIPLSFIGPRDRYLVLADLLHDILHVKHLEQHMALVRLEDIGATFSMNGMEQITRYLQQSHIPFSVAAIPHYRDPFGVYSGAVPVDTPLAGAPLLQAALQRAVERGGDIVMHGFTHQYDGARNPHSGVSGEDYEFWDTNKNAPVAGDSVSWASTRLKAGLAEFKNAGLTPVAWGPPHYQDSPNAIKAAKQLFQTFYQRSYYYTSDTPTLAAIPGRDVAVDQFFPFEITKDHYGRHIIPENLGNIRYGIGKDGVYNMHGEVRYTWQDVLINARYATMVRDGVASFFFHPYLADPTSGVPGMADFDALITGIGTMGFSWTKPSLMRPSSHKDSKSSSHLTH